MKKGKKKKKGNYFDQAVHDAILRLQAEPEDLKKHDIFVKDIMPAFKKLIENIIFVYKFHNLGNVDILKNECLSFLYENLNKFDGTKGHKAFSYFNVIARNWFIQRVKNYKKQSRSDIQFDRTLLSKLEKSENSAVVTSYEDDLLYVEFITLLKEEIKRWRDRFEKHQEKKVLEAVILLLENPELISIYNKKGIYLYIREITGLNTKQVVTNLSKMKKKYSIFKKKYLAGEI